MAEQSPAPPDAAPAPAETTPARPKNDRAAYILVALCAIFLLITFLAYAGR